jgi:hypothetical protein
MGGKGRPPKKKGEATRGKPATKAGTPAGSGSKTRVKMAVRKRPTGGVQERIDEIRKIISKYGGSIEGIVDSGQLDDSFNASEFENFIQWVGADFPGREPGPER